MKKVLVISYHGLPLDAIASYRAKAYLDHFHKYKIYPTLVTHIWEKDQNEPRKWKFHKDSEEVAFSKNECYEIYRVPRKLYKISRWQKVLPSKLKILIKWIKGDLDYGIESSYFDFRKFLFNHLQSHQYDLVLAIFSPHNHLKLAYEINQEFSIPYVLDFRDLWDNRIMSQSYSPTATERWKNLITHYWWNKWISKSNFIVITSESWLRKMEDMFHKKGLVVENGFEEEIFFIKEKPVKDLFCIGFAGSLYPAQKLDIFIQGVSDFIKEEAPVKFEVHFVGLNERNWPGIHELLKSSIPEINLKVTERVPKAQALEMLKSVHLLYYPAFDTIEGWCSAKIYDYLAVGKNILVAPGDKGIVNNIISKTEAGFVANDSVQVKEYIKSKYEEWSSKGIVSYHGNINEIKKFSRETQVKKLADKINTSPYSWSRFDKTFFLS